MASALHLLVKVFPFFLVFEIRDKLFDGFYHLSLGEVGIGEEGFKLAKKAVNLIHIVTSCLLHHGQGCKPTYRFDPILEVIQSSVSRRKEPPEAVSSAMRFEAPMIFTGLAALSVLTQKGCQARTCSADGKSHCLI